jgi:hypothetical protein
MFFIKRLAYALLTWVYFFLVGFVLIISLGYVFAKIRGLHYVFHDAWVQGIHTGLYLGSVIALLALISAPRRRPSL